MALDPAALAFTLASRCSPASSSGWRRWRTPASGALSLALKEGGAAAPPAAARHGVRRALVVAEVALAIVLVVGAGLMMRTILNLSSVDAGFTRTRLTTFALDLPNANYPASADRARFYQRLVGELGRCPACRASPP